MGGEAYSLPILDRRTIPCALRRPITLSRTSAHIHLATLGFQTAQQQLEGLERALDCLSEAFAKGDLESVFRSEVSIALGDGAVKMIPLCTANTQLHGLNDRSDGFKYGYEPDVAAAIDFFVPSEGVMVDAGANFGYFSLYLASRAGFVGLVHAFEPSSRGFADLRTLVSLSGLDDRVQIYPLALGDSQGEVTLLMSRSDGLSTTSTQLANSLEKVLREESVAMRRLDDFALERLDFLKVDVEGAESAVLAGGVKTIRATCPVICFESWQSVDDRPAFGLLRELGYTFYLPGWPAPSGRMTLSVEQATDRSQLMLVAFEAEHRRRLPARLNVMAIPKMRAQF